MIREKLCAGFKDFKVKWGLSYTYLQGTTGLSRSQLYSILNNNGSGVKVERIEQALYLCGLTLTVEILE